MNPLPVAAVQLTATVDPGGNAALVRAAVAQAADSGARLVVLPEYSLAWAPRLRSELAEGHREFEAMLAAVAAEHQVWIAAGTLRPHGQRMHNVTLVLAPDGTERASYVKVHLFDAFGARESEVLDAGEPGVAVVVEIEGWRVGLATCYDLRFPETFRVLADAGAQVFAVGAAWATGPGKVDQLQVLARARALENTGYLILASQSGPGRCGHSSIIGPLAEELAHATLVPEVVIAELDPERITQVRQSVPSLQHRRYAVVPKS
ncbi:MAG: nitrilase-related carbon-nitrogen hydrolase [Beutenbergiaceae bacterium]